MSGFDKLRDTLIDYNQFKKSNLQFDIMKVLDCDYTEAFSLGKTHCNLLSTWSLLYCQELTKFTYRQFYKECLTKKYCNKEGFFYIDRVDTDAGPGLFTKMKIPCEIIKYDTIPIDLSPDRFFQIAINKKSHFMASASGEDSALYLFDTNDRPYNKELIEALSVKKDKIVWLKEYKPI